MSPRPPPQGPSLPTSVVACRRLRQDEPLTGNPTGFRLLGMRWWLALFRQMKGSS